MWGLVVTLHPPLPKKSNCLPGLSDYFLFCTFRWGMIFLKDLGETLACFLKIAVLRAFPENFHLVAFGRVWGATGRAFLLLFAWFLYARMRFCCNLLCFLTPTSIFACIYSLFNYILKRFVRGSARSHFLICVHMHMLLNENASRSSM